MSDQLEKATQELNQVKVQLAQVSARLAANEQFTNTTIKDLLDTKTNLNLYMQAHQEVSDALNKANAANDAGNAASQAVVKELTEKNELLSKELEELKNPSCPSDNGAVMDNLGEVA